MNKRHTVLMPQFASNQVYGGFGTRLLGNAKSPDDLRRIITTVLPQSIRVIRAQQTHSTNIKIISSHTDNDQPQDTDGLITKEPLVALTIHTADCVPILYYDSTSSMIGISHQGWKGSLNNMAGTMIHAMLAYGASIDTLQAAVGPCICKKHYLIDSTRASLFIERYPKAAQRFLEQTNKNQFSLDLSLLNYIQLEEAGIAGDCVEIVRNCTFEDETGMYSYRREYPRLSGQLLHMIMMYV